MKRGWQLATVALLVLFAAFAYESLKLSLSDALGPGPGFFSFWLSVLGGILGAILLVQLKLGRAALAGELVFEREGTRRVVLMLAGLIVAAALLEPLGFSLSMLVLMVYLLLALGARSRIAIAMMALGGSFGVYYLFYDLLKVPLPGGILGG
jgi:putative tricarboxylic transport membrane protein